MATLNRALLLDPTTSAFSIIDIQNDFLVRDGYFAERGLPVEEMHSTIAATNSPRDALPPQVRVIYTVQIYETGGSDDIGPIHRIKPTDLISSWR